VTGPRLLNARQLADYLGLSTATVLDRFEAGDLPGFRLFPGRDKKGRPTGPVRFRSDEVDIWLEGCRVAPREASARSGT
jgi:predicted DNA-binding transcriptional regulator AlpA